MTRSEAAVAWCEAILAHDAVVDLGRASVRNAVNMAAANAADARDAARAAYARMRDVPDERGELVARLVATALEYERERTNDFGAFQDEITARKAHDAAISALAAWDAAHEGEP